MTLAEIFSTKFLFDAVPPRESDFYLPLLVFFSIFIIIGILAKVAGIKGSQAANRYFLPFSVPGVIGLIHLFCRYEGLPWLGSRSVLALNLLIMFIWFAATTFKAIRTLPKQAESKIKYERYEKYLPKPKKG